MALVVDEYDHAHWVATLKKVQKEIVGTFTTDSVEENLRNIASQDNNGLLIDGGTFVRDVSRAQDW